MSNDIFLGGTIRPGTTDPVIDARDAIDGLRSVANAAARLALTAPYLRKGMVVVDQDTLLAFQLTVLSPPTWAPFAGGSSGADIFIDDNAGGYPAPVIVTIYVRSTGNDVTGDGLTPGTAYLTPERAAQDVAEVSGGIGYVIDMTGYGVYTPASGQLAFGGYFAKEVNFFNNFFLDPVWGAIEYGHLTLKADPTVLSILDPGFSSASDLITGLVTITDATQAWVVNAFAGKFLIDDFGYAATIESNTATQLVVASSFAPFDPANSHIVDYTCELNVNQLWFGRAQATIAIYGFKVYASGGTGIAELDIIHQDRIKFTGCDLQANVFPDGCRLLSLVGCYAHGVNPGTLAQFRSGTEGGRTNVFSSRLAYFSPLGGGVAHFTISSTIVDSCAPLGEGFTNFPPHGDLSLENLLVKNGSASGIHLPDARQSRIASVKSENNADHGILLSVGSQVEVVGDIGGAGNSLLGWRLLDGSRVLRASGTMTITGALGDFQVGLRPVRSWVHYVTQPPVETEYDVTGDGSRFSTKFQTEQGLWATTAIKTALYTTRVWESVLANPTAGGFVVNIPTAVDVKGQQLKVKNVSASVNAITLTPFGGETIDGAATFVMNTGFQATWLESDGTNWMVV